MEIRRLLYFESNRSSLNNLHIFKTFHLHVSVITTRNNITSARFVSAFKNKKDKDIQQSSAIVVFKDK